MDDVVEYYRTAFRTAGGAVAVLDGSARAGIEAALVSVVEPGDRVLVPVFGRFGLLVAEIAKRCGANVHVLERPWGSVFAPDEVEASLKRVRPKVLAVVHGETSSGMRQPISDLGKLCDDVGALLYCDVTTTLGGNAVEVDGWGIDVATAGLQKCLGGPPGSSPVCVSDKARKVLRARRHIEAGLRGVDDDEVGVTIRSNYFDLGIILEYWGERRLNHHTQGTSMLYAAHECGRLLAEEGVENAIERHRLNGQAMAEGLGALGLPLFGEEASSRLTNLLVVEVPKGLDEVAFRRVLRDDFALEIASGLGALCGKVWRIGVMGYNARKDAVMVTLSVIEQTLREFGMSPEPGAGVSAAEAVYSGGGGEFAPSLLA